MNENPTQNLVSATNVYKHFVDKIEDVIGILIQAESQADIEYYSGALGIENYIETLKRERDKLKSKVFRFLVIGDKNRGKSTIINVLLGEELLPEGAVATTAIPTLIRYGKKQKMTLYYDDNVKEEISIADFNKKHTHSSRKVKKAEKKYKETRLKELVREGLDRLSARSQLAEEWINHLIGTINYACLEAPVTLLAKKVEFIDTAGLNNSETENEKAFAYIKNCEAIIFILDPNDQISLTDKAYLQKFLDAQVNVENIFFLINKWDDVEEADKQDIKEAFVINLAQTLHQDPEVIEQLWGQRIFTVSARNALKNIKRRKAFQGTGFPEFTTELSNFLKYERLNCKIAQPVKTTQQVSKLVSQIIEQRLAILQDDITTLSEKEQKAQPYFAAMKKICSTLEQQVNQIQEQSAKEIVESYQKYFTNACQNFTRNSLDLPNIDKIAKQDRDRFTKEIQEKIYQFMQDKFQEWNEQSQAKINIKNDQLKIVFHNNLQQYLQHKEIVQSILVTQYDVVLDEAKSDYVPQTPEEIQLQGTNSNDSNNWVLAGTTTGGAIVGGTMGVVAALSITPVGWVAVGVGVISAIGVGVWGWIWGNDLKQDKFSQAIKQQLEAQLPEILSKQKLSVLNNHIKSQFDSWHDTVELIKNDITSLEVSLNNLISQKQQHQVNFSLEETRLENIKTRLTAKSQEIIGEYKQYNTN
ncbi:dynamin family protein [Xenococcus sp. PCC 7305]|uniref:dynamin family protein n=1 Tax=Xenococcus sp. PCC 7305 TaxID=102125 RepID=UPI0002ACF21F|nr:dynamin family protein [Xenococcus sp. PCC 7305]ELS03605.1 dynamin family protein [Xenococcus sp. PCC 7305]